MASLDFIKDASEKLKQQKINHLIFTLREYKEKDLVDILIHFESDSARDKLIEIINKKIETN